MPFYQLNAYFYDYYWSGGYIMEQEINEMTFYLSAAIFIGLILVFAWYLYTHKKKEGISYRAAIYKITHFASQRYSGQNAIEQFCEDYEIPERGSFLRAVAARGEEVLVPQIVGDALNKIGYRVHLVNKVYYLQNPS